MYLIGEDMLDPYGGAFKVTKGVSSKFPERVITTPISESAIIGLGTGMAMRGMLPVVEIMFGDFLTLCTDQIVNSATKFPLMYKDRVAVPLVIRTPMGGGRGYGPTHSQSLEKMFLGVPGLRVVSPSLAHDPGKLLWRTIISCSKPTLFVEYKSLYPKQLINSGDGFSLRIAEHENDFPAAVLENYSESDPDIIIVAYGGASEQVLDVMRTLIDEEIKVRAIFPSELSVGSNEPWWFSEISSNVPIILAEHGTMSFNWGSEIASLIHRFFFNKLVMPVTRLSSSNDVIPAASEKEKANLLSANQIMKSIFHCLES